MEKMDESKDKMKPALWEMYFKKSWDEVCEPLRNVDWIPNGGEGKRLVVPNRR